IVIFISSVILIYLFACIIFYYANLKNLDEAFGKKLISVAKISAREISSLNLDLLLQPPLSEVITKRIEKKIKPIAEAADIENITIINKEKITYFDLKNSEMEGEKNPFVYAYSNEIEKAFSGTSTFSTLYRGKKGNLYKSAFVPIRDNKNKIRWVLSVDANPEFLNLIDYILKWIVISGAVSLCVTLFLSLIFGTTVVRKIKKLDHVANQISMGNFDVSVDSPGKDEIDHLAQTFNDMVKSINEMKKFYEYILDSTLSGIITVNFVGLLTSINPAAIKILELEKEREDYLNKNIFEILSNHGNIPTTLEKLLKEKSFAEYIELNFKNSSGEEKFLGATTSLLKNEASETIGMTLSFIDITEIKKLEKKLELNARLAALGEMSAGIAHEIRNPLGSIQIYMDLLKKRISKESENIEICNQVIEEVDKLNAFITEFLVYARPPRLAIQKHDIHKVLDEVISGLPIKESENIEIVKKYKAGENIFLNVDKMQIKRAFLNVFLNSLEALKGKGRIVVETEIINAAKTEDKTNQQRIRISIIDNGSGIDENKLKHIFEPFYTTKESGTGLGLPITEKIVREHNGKIEIKSRKGETAANFYFLISA
ncbi:MAG: HAMP domain-containing protein, partial [Candidatus Schekmanbacteria bacterium]